ncbi:MAG: non-lysosomal glucosylceramidase [Verrucomicrobiae bacterium]|nr:non-lysosomal glucosylceramidase [Verrucomicrobiae bacterium]
MAKQYQFNPADLFTISGAQIHTIYVKNKMTVHFQGMSKTMQFPQTIFLQGAPTCSVGISPDGLYNRLNDAGRLVFLNQKAIQLASAPFVQVGDEAVMLTTKNPEITESPDDIPVAERYYHPPVSLDRVTISIATPMAEIAYKLPSLRIVRRFVSPFLAGAHHALIPIGVEEFEVTNTSGKEQQVILVLPRPSLANLQQKKYRPIDQDSAYLCAPAVRAHKHEAFDRDGLQGVIMGSTESPERMVICVPKDAGVRIDTQPYFRLNSLKQDLLLRSDGSFYYKPPCKPHHDYGAAISVAFTLRPKETRVVPLAVAFDFPEQWYADDTVVERKYVRHFKNATTRAFEMAKLALENYKQWQERTLAFQRRVFERVRQTPAYRDDLEGALRLTRLILNELSAPLSNASVWIEDKHGNDVARFVECFDYPYNNSSDVDWYSMVLLWLFPEVEQELCQRTIDSILQEDLTERFYHIHASFIEARKHFEEHPEEYEGVSLTHIRAPTKIKGSVAHDLGAMPFGCPLKNKSEYTWYNTNYWTDLFPKLALRVLRNVKFTGDVQFLKRNWDTLKFGFDYLMKLDFDGDGVPEGHPNEVKNTFDNIHLFGVDAYSVNVFLAGCHAMIRMAQIVGDKNAQRDYEQIFQKALQVYEKLWTETRNRLGRKLEYYVTCFDPVTGKKNTDVWTNQLDGLWYLIAMGEEPFLPADRVRKVLRTIFVNNRTMMGWSTAQTKDAKPVKSDQGKDVWVASNYVLAQMLDYYGMTEESKQVYRLMDKVIFQHGHSLISPESVRPTLEKEKGETKKGPHYIVAGYPRPGAIFTHLAIQHVKQVQEQTGKQQVEPEKLQSCGAPVGGPHT